MRNAHVYIMTNKPMGILYIGVTDNLPARIFAGATISLALLTFHAAVSDFSL